MKRTLLLLFVLMICAKCFAAWNVFVPTSDGFEPLEMENDDLSLIGIAALLGYNSDQFYFYNSSTDSDIDMVVFKIFSDDIMFVCCNENVKELTNRDIDVYLSEFDFKKEYGSYDQEYSLTKGIEHKSLSIAFMSDVLNLPYTDPNQTLVCEEFGYKLNFEEGILSGFTSLDGLNKWAKEWKSRYFNRFYYPLECEAKKYWGDDSRSVTDCINTQADAFSRLPGGVTNPHIAQFTNSLGVTNYKLMLVAYYDEKINLRELKDLTFGACKYVKKIAQDDSNYYVYQAYNTLFVFDGDDNLFLVQCLD